MVGDGVHPHAQGELPRALLCPSSRPHTLPFLFLPPSPLTDADVPIAWLETAYIHMLRVDVPVPSDFSCVFFLFSLFAFLPSPLTDAEDLIQWLETAYIYMAMVDYPVPSDFLMPLPAHPIRESTASPRVLISSTASMPGWACITTTRALRHASVFAIPSPSLSLPIVPCPVCAQLCRHVDSLPSGADLLDRIAAGVGVYYNYSGSKTRFNAPSSPPPCPIPPLSH
ncbi:unnamed protein product, partial [Closterium sp. NIES-53]